MTKPIPSAVYVPIPFPESGNWLNEGNSKDLGEFRQGLCSGSFFKTADNQLYVFLEMMTWPDVCIKAYIPLRVPSEDEDASTLHIRWGDTGAHLQQDAYPSIHATWQPRG